MIVVPLLNPLITSYNATVTNTKSEYDEFFSLINYKKNPDSLRNVDDILMPGEIGKFLMTKTTFLPESYDACISLMDKYKQEDLHNVMTSLQQGFKQNNFNIVSTKSTDLSEIFDSLWSDSKRISKLSKGINYGVSLSLGAIGAIVTAPALGIGALIGLGFNVADKSFPLITENISKFFSPNYMIAIHDFSKKYPISL